MRHGPFTEKQTLMALGQEEGGTTVTDICRELEITEEIFYRWK